MSYRTLKVRGEENIPGQDCAVIFAPNHSNTLMDALVILQHSRKATAFGARADIFKQKTAARILRFLRILPLARQRDGNQAVSGNDAIFDEAIDCINHNVPFCMFVEGTHRTKHSILPIKKGIFRIATKAAAQLNKPVYIVPVGIDYSDYFHYMSDCLLSFGEPIKVEADSDIASLKDLLHERMSQLITYFPDDENYDKSWSEYELTHSRNVHWWHYPIAILLFPIYVYFLLLCSPMVLASEIIGGKMKDKAWSNTVRYSTKLILLPILFILWAVLGFIFLPWWLVLIILASLLVSHSVFFVLQGFYRFVFKIK